MSQSDFSRPRECPAADYGRIRSGMMRRPEWRFGDYILAERFGNGMDGRDFNDFVIGERG